MPFGERFIFIVVVAVLIVTGIFLVSASAERTTESEKISKKEQPSLNHSWGLGYAVQETFKAAKLAEYLDAVKASQIAEYISAVEKSKQTSPSVSHSYRASATPSYSNSGSSAAECIKQRESGGNYSTNTGNGYYGAYQFLQSTWNNAVSSMGRSDLVGVRPSDASPADQDAAFNYLYAGGSGASHWGGGC